MYNIGICRQMHYALKMGPGLNMGKSCVHLLKNTGAKMGCEDF